MVIKMVVWSDLLYAYNKWDESGYERIEMEKILDKPFIVEKYELFESTTYGPGIRILLSDDLKVKRDVVTFSTVIVNAFEEHQDKVAELIKQRVPMKIVLKTLPNGRKMYTFA